MTRRPRKQMTADEARALGERIRRAREDAGLSLRALAAAVDFHAPNLKRLEEGENLMPSASLLQDIADTLEVDAAELLTFIGVKPVLPEPSIYLRQRYGLSEGEAREIAAFIEQQTHQTERRPREQPPFKGQV